MVELTVSGLSRRYGRRSIFSGLELDVTGGTVAAVTGPNGSGKSTLLRTLAGLERPEAGIVTWREAGREWSRSERRRRIGFLSPELHFYRELSGFENLHFSARLRGCADPGAEARARLAQVGLTTRAGDRVAEYSTGMIQRLRLAFALLGSPPVLLLDEPGQNLDAEGTGSAAAIIDRARSEQRLVIVATNVAAEKEMGDVELRL